ncbi:unnamed protein product [Linum trigynum]|uniref:Uncharacterized protein n=1 Tax=Linum trigynum TaxID=586398 RepID=A0AAV2GM38_9ROSI
MDLWVVGAAAAAGYIAKHWQNNSKSVPDSSSEVLTYDKPESPSCPISRLIHRKIFSKDSVTGGRRTDSDDRFSDVYSVDGHSEPEAVSSSNYVEKPGGSGDYQDWNAPLGPFIQPGFSMVGNMKNIVGACDSSSDTINYPSQHCSNGMDFNSRSGRNRSSLRKRYPRTHYIKPINSLESCLVTQLWNDHTETEEYVFGPLPSPSTPMRPLLVTNGSQIISRSCLKSRCVNYTSGECNEEAIVCGVPSLPKIGTSKPGQKIQSGRGKECSQKLTSFDKQRRSSISHSLNGSIGENVSFFLGISIGVISSLVANKREVEKLKDSLKLTQNLVQDLQEELEMKDLVTVKELAANENYKSQATSENFSDKSDPKLLFHAQNENTELNNENAKAPEYMSKIEAELEAELEMLGLNMNASSIEGKFSGPIDLDPDFVADFAHGELKVDIIRDGDDANTETEKDASGASTTHSGDHAVSPKELSLRLHEVIQSRLEARVRELEIDLESSQRKVHQLMESEDHSLVWRLSSRELRYSSSGEDGSPVVGQVGDFSSAKMAQQPPVVMNLSGEALDAYNEVYEELGKMNESVEEEDDSPTSFYEDFTQHKEELLETEAQYSDNIASEEESDSNEDMEELIKRIVERTKRGSPAVVNAQMMLSSIDEKLRY